MLDWGVSEVLTAKLSHHSNNDYEVLKLKNFRGPFTSNSKTFYALFCFQGLSSSWKNWYFLQGLSRTYGHPELLPYQWWQSAWLQCDNHAVCYLVACNRLEVLVPSVLDAVGWVAGRASVGCWHGYLSGARCRLAYGPADATATYLPYQVSGTTLTAVGRFQLLARWPGTHSQNFIRDPISSTDCFWRLLKTYLFAHY